MSANQADTKSRFPLRTMCRVLGVSSSGYHDWLGRRPSARQTANARLAEQILQVHQASDGTYGMPRVRAQLRAEGHSASRKRIARRSFKTKAQARTALFTWIEGWYNPRRLHSSLGYLSPIKFEETFVANNDRAPSCPRLGVQG